MNKHTSKIVLKEHAAFMKKQTKTLIFIIIISGLIIVSAISQVYASEYGRFGIDDPPFKVVIIPEVPIIGEPVTIFCEIIKGDRPWHLSTVVYVDGYRLYDKQSDTTATMTFDTSSLVEVSCLGIYDTPPTDFIQVFLYFYPIDRLQYEDSLPNTKSNGCNDCTPPTLGYDSMGVKRVDNGICINNICVDGGEYHTDYPMQYTTLYLQNTISLKYYENNGPSNMRMVQLGIGVDEIGMSLSESQAVIEVWLNPFKGDMYNPTIQEIIIVDTDEILAYANATVQLVQCMDDSNNKLGCLQTDFFYSYAKPPTSPILVTNAWDIPRNIINNYINDGLAVTDNTISDMSIDIVDTLKTEPKCTTTSTQVDRNNKCQFQLLVDYEIKRAMKYYTDLR